IAAAWAALALSGCTPDRFANSLPPSTADVNRITTDEDLSAQEKRVHLQNIGVPPDVVNGLLRDERLGNQFGGDLRAAYDKVAGGRFTELTPDEVQLYADAASASGAVVESELGDDVAQAVADLFVNENIDDVDELSVFLADPTSEVPGPIPENLLRDLFVDLDPSSLISELP
ncbi:unnamed protein product, partial [marine sediment metagenome]